MKGLISWYNTNRKTFWTVIGVVASVLIVIRLLNVLSSESLKRKQSSVSNIINKESLTNSISMGVDESTVSGQKLTSEQKSLIKILDQFASHMNKGEIDKAYALLSNECKEEMYPTQEFFKSAYYDQVFSGSSKDITAENWVGNTYKVRFVADALSTGSYDSGSAKQDYITIVKDENGNAKLNVNGYIGREKLNVSGKTGNVEIKVVETNVYMDYQTFTYEIRNNSNKAIMIHEPNIVDAMYIADSKGIKYTSYTHELTQADSKVVAYETKKLKIKYYSKYISTKKIENIVFGRIILDYPEYANPGDIYKNYGSIKIKL